jgi:tripartite motif-containing protein 56
MTAFAEFVDPVDELLKCSICLDTFTNPKSLPCLHTFCQCCIQHAYKDKLPGDSVACPDCRHKFAIPLKGAERLPSNIVIKNLIDSKKSSGKLVDNVPCDVCSSDSELNPSSVPCASMCCKTCGQKLCSRCSKPHQMIPGGAHQVVTLNKQVMEELQRTLGNFCSSHSGNKVEIYWFDCCMNICVTCHAIKHRTHNCHDINDHWGTF